MITGPQCRAGRALIEVTRTKLAVRSGVDEAAIEKFERKLQELEPGMIVSLQSALETLGAVFIDENGGGIGVRLKFTESEARRIARLESEVDWSPTTGSLDPVRLLAATLCPSSKPTLWCPISWHTLISTFYSLLHSAAHPHTAERIHKFLADASTKVRASKL